MKPIYLRFAVITMYCSLGIAHANEIEIRYDNVDISGWNCYLCEFEQLAETRRVLRVQSLTASDASAHFGRESGVDNSRTYPIVDYQYRSEINESTSFTSRSSGLGMQARSFESRIEKVGSWGISVASSNQPQNFNRNGRTPFRQIDNRLALDPNWVSGYSTDEFSAFHKLGEPVYLRKERSQIQTNAWLRLSTDLKARVDWTKQTQKGVKESYRDDLYASTALPIAYSNETVRRTLQLLHDTERVQSILHVRESSFASAYPSFEWESPYAEQDSLRRSALPPSTDGRRIQLRSRFALTETSTLRLNLAKGDLAQQAQTLLPYSTNLGLNTEVPTLNPTTIQVSDRSYALAYVQRLNEHLSIESSISHLDRIDQRPNTVLMPTIGDLFTGEDIVLRSLNLTRREVRVHARSRFGENSRLDIGLRRGLISRSNQEIVENVDRVWWVNMISPLNSKIELSTSYERHYRDASEFTLQSLNNPATRRFHAANRKAQLANLSLEYKINPHVSVTLTSTLNRSDYPESEIGLNQTSAHRKFIQLKYIKPNRNSFRISHGIMSQSLANNGHDWSEFGSWSYMSDGQLTATDVNLELYDVINSRFSIAFNWQRLDDVTTEISERALEEALFPQVQSDTSKTSLEIGYTSAKENQLSLRLLRQSVLMQDWQLQGIHHRTIANVLSLGRSLPNYKVATLTVGWERAF